MPDGDTGRALLAGWISGAAVAFVQTGLLLFALAGDPRWRELFGRTTLRLPLVGVVVVNAMMLFWTLIGLVLGALHLGVGQPAFSIAVAAMIGLGLVLVVVVRGMPGWLTWATVAAALAAFAGLLPGLVALG